MDNLNVTIPWPGWKVVRHIGSGSYGDVYEIERENYGEKEKAALKVMTIPQSRGEIEEKYASGYDEASVRGFYKQYLEKIETEYRLMKTLKGSSNIVYCEDSCEVEHEGDIGWDIYIRMELLEPLNKLLLKRNLTEEEIIKLGKDICRALKACEAENIVHRDIKPGNILLSKYGDFKLGDFGVARTMDHTTHATKAGAELYMAPEVIRREAYGKEVDIYSLGIVMYTLLNKGRMPYLPIDRAATPDEVDDAFDRRVRPAEKSQFRLPAPAYGSDALKRIVLKACEYRKEDRYQTADEMLKDLERLTLGGLEDVTYPAPEEGEADKDTVTEIDDAEEHTISDVIEIEDPPTEGNNWTGDQKTDDVVLDGEGDALYDPPTEGVRFEIPSKPRREDKPVSPKEQPEQSHPDLGPQPEKVRKGEFWDVVFRKGKRRYPKLSSISLFAFCVMLMFFDNGLISWESLLMCCAPVVLPIITYNGPKHSKAKSIIAGALGFFVGSWFMPVLSIIVFREPFVGNTFKDGLSALTEYVGGYWGILFWMFLVLLYTWNGIVASLAVYEISMGYIKK